ncbi:MYPU_1760 family metalloprotease [Mycoplasmopsis caviae]|uniref:Uncharacterized protein n=1 Tax=Mycoplasmopsis caviae TaxID=55603 RepID=A0A3P8KWE1_9BACT|nr:hypothetical protein [Mycoplasmopsis caviae]VDR41697.1 Uncharacterised protein [Mycoplasmopsis caviae]
MTNKNYIFNKENWVKKGEFKFQNNSWVYIDPLHNVKFTDKSYGFDENGKPRFLLGPYGLALLANYFYSRMTYGPEIKFIDSININDFSIIGKTAAGIYLPTIQRIYLNGSVYSEKGIKLELKVRQMLYALFHEYMHHWGYSYASYGSLKQVTEGKTSLIAYRSDLNDKLSHGYWYKKFAADFKKILYFDNKYKSTMNEETNFVPYLFSLNDLWNLSNSNDNLLLARLKLINSMHKYLSFVEEGEKTVPQFTSTILTENIPYYYSLTELLPREWQKFAYIPFNDPDNPYDHRYWKVFKSETIEGLKIGESFYGLSISKGKSGVTYSSNYSSDWSRTIYKAELENNRNIYDNNIYEHNNQEEFYKLFLETMGYGKVISQVKSKIKVKELNASDDNRYSADIDKKQIYQTRLSGYLNNKKIKGFYYIDKKSGDKKLVRLNFLNAFKFEAKRNLFDTNFSLLPYEVLNNLRYKHAAYVSDYFDYQMIKVNSPIYFWKDDNNDNIVQDNELISEYDDNPLPDRYLISSDTPSDFEVNKYDLKANFVSKLNANNRYSIYFNEEK